MPYIITTTKPGHAVPVGAGASYWVADDIFRTAVATLDEARSNAHNIVHESYRQTYPLKPRGLGGEHSDAQRAHRWHNVDVEKLPESGGTIGPLPDGTVIEVRPVTHQWLVGQIGFGQRNQMWFRNAAAVDVIAAFNQQAFNA